MTDIHFHRDGSTFASSAGIDFRFDGVHPWEAGSADVSGTVQRLRLSLEADPSRGVGEIGLDRLRTGTVTPEQRGLFLAQLEVAAEAGRPVVLHGVKCWGEVVKAVKPFAGAIPAFLFHGFSRSDGLLPDIVGVNGYIGVGRAVLNDHAVNYRELVKKIPRDRIVAETDCEGCSEEERIAVLGEVYAKVTGLASVTESDLDSNAAAFLDALK